MTALVQAGLEVYRLLVALMAKKDCFWFPMNVGWCIKIRDTHVQNAISSVFPKIPNWNTTTFFCRYELLQSLQHLRYDLGRFAVRRGLHWGREC